MKNKTLVYGAIVGVGAYIYFKNKKDKSVEGGFIDNLPPAPAKGKPSSKILDDKISVFKRANNFYQGGAKPSEELLKNLEIEREKAMAIIMSFKLEEEFKKWRSSLTNSLAFPNAKPVMVGDKGIGVYRPEISQPYYESKNPPKKYS
jgi:hypothetical protein